MRYISILIFGLLSSLSIASDIETTCSQRHCIAVVDAGSTGSRLHIYAYDEENNAPVHIDELYTQKIKPGLATLSPNQETLDHYLSLLFMGVPDIKIPVYFYATAGMRLISLPKQEQLYRLINTWFSERSPYELKDLKTITGQEEGVFGWVAVNYQTGHLNTPASKPIGIMDMGGASVQIVFPIDKTIKAQEDDVVDVEIYGQRHHLYAKSFLGLGQTEMSHQFLNDQSCFSRGYKLPDGLVANGNASECASHVSVLLNKVQKVKARVRQALQDHQAIQWYTIGGLSYHVVDIALLGTQGQAAFTPQSLLQSSGRNHCEEDWQSLSKTTLPSSDNAYGYCLYSSYYYALLVSGYGLDDTTPIHTLSNNQSGDWTLGVVLVH